MKRTTKPIHNDRERLLLQMQRTLLLGRVLGSQYGGDRNLYEALGYPTVLTFDDYESQYSRQDIAGAIINRPIELTWKGTVKVTGAEGKETQLEKEWKKLWKDLKLKNKFTRVDKMSTLGQYAVLLLGFNDTDGGKLNWEQAVSGKPSILYVTPFSEDAATISEWDTDPASPRCGLPLIYSLTRTNEAGVNSQTFRVHYSRVLHITGETLDSEVYGVPYLQRVFNRLMDIEKLSGGSAEMFWRGARPGITADVDPEFSAPTDLKATLDSQMKDYEHNLRRVLINQGVTMRSLEQQVSDPEQHIKLQVELISAYTGIPVRILLGSERGELASSQDRDTWVEFIQTRRGEYAESQILIPFIEKMMELGILTSTEEYTIEWEDLATISNKAKADLALVITQALAQYGNSTAAQEIVPPEAFMEHIINLPENVINSILEAREKYLLDIAEQEQEEQQMRAEGLLPEEETETDEEIEGTQDTEE